MVVLLTAPYSSSYNIEQTFKQITFAFYDQGEY